MGKKSVNPTAAAIAGLAVGAPAGAAATALSDKNNRKKLEKRLGEINQQTQQAYDRASKKIDKAFKAAEPKLREGFKKMTTNPDTGPTKTRTRLKRDQIVDQTADQIDELATKGGEVIHTNLPEK